MLNHGHSKHGNRYDKSQLLFEVKCDKALGSIYCILVFLGGNALYYLELMEWCGSKFVATWPNNISEFKKTNELFTSAAQNNSPAELLFTVAAKSV